MYILKYSWQYASLITYNIIIRVYYNIAYTKQFWNNTFLHHVRFSSLPPQLQISKIFSAVYLSCNKRELAWLVLKFAWCQVKLKNENKGGGAVYRNVRCIIRNNDKMIVYRVTLIDINRYYTAIYNSPLQLQAIAARDCKMYTGRFTKYELSHLFH